MPKRNMHIGGRDKGQSPIESLQKLLNGFCNPKKHQPGDDDTVADGTYTSEPDLSSQVQERQLELEQLSGETAEKPSQSAPQPDNTEDEGVEVTVSDSLKDRERKVEIKATHLDRRARVRWGLGIAFVALIAVFATLFTLHRLGYEMADFTFTGLNAPSKPLIQIQYNEKKQKAETIPKVSSVKKGEVSSEQDTSKVDRAQEKLDALLALVAEIKSSEL